MDLFIILWCMCIIQIIYGAKADDDFMMAVGSGFLFCSICVYLM